MSIRTSKVPAAVIHVVNACATEHVAVQFERNRSCLLVGHPSHAKVGAEGHHRSASRSRFSLVDFGTQSRSSVARTAPRALAAIPPMMMYSTPCALEHGQNSGRIERTGLGAQSSVERARSARSRSSSSRNAITASRESSRRPSQVIDTSSGVGGPHRVRFNASRSHSRRAESRRAAISKGYEDDRRPWPLASSARFDGWTPWHRSPTSTPCSVACKAGRAFLWAAGGMVPRGPAPCLREPSGPGCRPAQWRPGGVG